MSLESAEIVLIQEAIKGSRKAFEELVQLNQQFILNVARKFGPKEEIENIFQETFISAFKAISSLRDPLAFRGWIHSIAIRRCRDSWRSVYRRKSEISLESIGEKDLEQKDLVNSNFSLDTNIQGRLDLETVLNQLSADDRMVMTLLYLEDRSVKNVSQLLGLTQVNVKVRAHRIKKRLLKLSKSEIELERAA